MKKILGPPVVLILVMAVAGATVQAGPLYQTILDIPIAAAADDAAEDTATKLVYLDDVQLFLTQYAGVPQDIGLRFNISVPQGAVIQTAYIDFSSSANRSAAASVQIRAEAADNAPAFTAANNNISARPGTAASVAWSPGAWSNNTAYQSPDLASVVQEVVNRPGWAGGNAIAFIITGTGNRVYWAYDGNPARAPKLHIEYLLPTPTPTNTPAATPTATPAGPTPTATSTPPPGATPTPTPTAIIAPLDYQTVITLPTTGDRVLYSRAVSAGEVFVATSMWGVIIINLVVLIRQSVKGKS